MAWMEKLMMQVALVDQVTKPLAGINAQMDLAPLAPAVRAMLARQPLSIAQELDPGAVHQQVQRSLRAAAGYLDGKGLLSVAQGREVRHWPIEPNHLQDAGHHGPCIAEGADQRAPLP